MFNYPKLVTTKSLSPPAINKKEWAKVTVSVYGDTRQQAEKVPISLVLALDYSGSMQAENAYQEVGAAANLILSQLTPGKDSVAVITIKTSATVQIPLTSNFAGLEQTINGFTPGGTTDIQGAFDQANGILLAAATPNKAVLLMSDGFPEAPGGGIDFAQMNYINSHWQTPAANGIRYYTIGYGPLVNEMLLAFLATKTGGMFQKAPTKQDLQATFATALQASTNHLSIGNVVLTEVVSADLIIRPNSLAKSLTSVLDDPVKFEAEFKAAEQAFYKTRVLKVPKIVSLGGQEMFAISFDVSSNQCSYKPLLIPVDDLSAAPGQSAAQVLYECGKPTAVVDPLAQATLEVKPCGVVLDKEFDEKALTVVLKLRNNYDHPIRHVRLIENASPYFFLGSPIVPPPTQLSRQTAQWLIGQIESDGERTFSLKFEDSPGQAGADPPYPVDGRDTSLSFTAEEFQCEILTQDAIFATFDQDLQALKVSAATQQFFANYPDPNCRFSIPLGPISTSTPDADLGWAIHAEIVHYSYTPDPVVSWKEPVDLLVKKTSTGYWIYRAAWKAVRPPQRWTSPNYHKP
jgi:hypothetical protein